MPENQAFGSKILASISATRGSEGALPCIAFERFAETSVADDHSSPKARRAASNPAVSAVAAAAPPSEAARIFSARFSAMSRNMPCCEARKSVAALPPQARERAHALERVDLRHGQMPKL